MTEAMFASAAAILAMALATAATRFAGYWMMSQVRLTRRIRRILEALPGAVIAATVLPIAAKGGLAAAAAVVAALLAMTVQRNSVLAIAAGVATAALIRAVGLG